MANGASDPLDAAITRVSASAVEHGVPLSPAQEQLWFLARLYPETPLYNEPIMVHLGGLERPVDARILQRCLTEILRRHDSWRTVFTSVEGRPAQRARSPFEIELPVVDLRDHPSEAREAEALRMAAEHARRPFDLERGPLVRALLLELSDQDARLVITAHHLVVDGISFFQVFLPELRSLYLAFSVGDPSPLDEPKLQFADFVAWQRSVVLTEERLAPRLAYWRKQLAGARNLELPTDRPRPAQPNGDGARVPVALPADLTARLRAMSRSAGVSLFTTLLAAWKTLLFRYSGETDVVVGSAAAGRPTRELEPLIGFFTNNLILRTHLDGAESFRSLLPRVGEVLREAREHQDVPFSRLLAELKVERSLNQTPFFQTLFILMPPLAESGGAHWNASRFETGLAKLDLYLELHQRPNGLTGHLEYQTELFDRETVVRMTRQLCVLLEGIADDPDCPLIQLPLLPDDERRAIEALERSADEPHRDAATELDEDPRSGGLEELFAEQARRTPSAIAVAHGAHRMSYSELDSRADQLAGCLRARGVGPEMRVGVCVERGLDAYVAILGVLKAGAAYVPLDPESPIERLQLIADDADLTVLLTQAHVVERWREAAALEQWVERAIRLDADWPTIARHPSASPAAKSALASAAYVIYTSGSTGRPKGVVVERRGLGHIARAQQHLFGLGVGQRVLAFFPLHFDGSVADMTLAWSAGATLVVIDREALVPGPSFAQLLADERIDATVLTPSVLTATPPLPPPALPILIAAGEALPEEVVARWAPGRRLFNAYGPTEATVVVSYDECRPGEGKPTIGRPAGDARIHLLDPELRRVPVGVPGEICIAGPTVARGYLNHGELTAARFVDDPFSTQNGARLFRTGDRARWRADGKLDYLGRVDRQIKLRGFRIELGEIESVLGAHPAVRAAAVTVRGSRAEDRRLVAYVVLEPGAQVHPLLSWLRERLPSYMVPSAVQALDELPLLPSGKVDYHRLPEPAQDHAESGSAAALATASELQRAIAQIWQDTLRHRDFGLDDNFFDRGGHSLLLTGVQSRVRADLGREIPLVAFYRYPTVRALAAHLEEIASGSKLPSAQPRVSGESASRWADGIAIVGMAGRFPGASSTQQFWRNLCDGIESIAFFSRRELLLNGISPQLVDDPSYVPAFGRVPDHDLFDAEFFGFSAREAEVLDPQHRLLLECAWHALEDAGYDPRRSAGAIGVFAGSGSEQYLHQHVRAHPDVVEALGDFAVLVANGRDFLATRVAYELDLKGPSLTIQTACSTSLVSVAMACRSLLGGECDMALAGGSSLNLAMHRGYRHQEGMVLSPDGHCRAFDARGAGTVGGDGVGVVVLKRLADALADGDRIDAVIRGAGLTNDGAAKVGYAAPSVEGQAKAIRLALATAGVAPDSIGYVESHGTGTPLGDPIEIEALTEALGPRAEPQSCALGAVKTNIGHLDAAAGIAGLIKATLSVKHRKLAPTLHFERPNPNLDLERGGFYVNAQLREWTSAGPRRAGVSSFGIGGTNAHLVLEEAPQLPPPAASRRSTQVLVLSARTPRALAKGSAALAAHLEAAHLEQSSGSSLADVAYTLQVGRRAFGHRRAVLATDAADAARALRGHPESLVSERRPDAAPRAVAFLFPGQGSQFVGMGQGLYETEPTFRAAIDACAEILQRRAPHLGADLRELIFPAAADLERATERLSQTMVTQPALFAIEYALAKLWMDWGVQPHAMLGHSVGEYVAACLAGVFELEDALHLVAERGRLMQSLPPGAMLAIPVSEAEAIALCAGELSVAAVNSPEQTVVAGPIPAIEALDRKLVAEGRPGVRLRTSHAFHSAMMEPILDEFERLVASVERRAPTLRYLSNSTGTWIDAADAQSPIYWRNHLRGAVQFSKNLVELFRLPDVLLLEVGPGRAVSRIVARHPERPQSSTVSVSLPGSRDGDPTASISRALAELWVAGVEIDWAAYHAGERRRRVGLPTYAFERRRYWLEPAPRSSRGERLPEPPASTERDLDSQCYQPVWKPSASPAASTASFGARRWLVLADETTEALAAEVRRRLEHREDAVTLVRPGARFEACADGTFVVDPGSAEDFRRLFAAASAGRAAFDVVLHLWSILPGGGPSLEQLGAQQDRSFYSLLYLAHAIERSRAGERVRKRVQLVVGTSGIWSTSDEPVRRPEQALVLGPCLVIPDEYEDVTCRCVDLDPLAAPDAHRAARLIAEVDAPEHETVVAHRGEARLLRSYERIAAAGGTQAAPLRRDGVFLITGGLGGIGLSLARHLASTFGARLVLTTRRPFPPPADCTAEDQERAERVRELEALGAQVLVVQADVTSREEMLACVETIRARFGKLHGVIHAAGVPGGGLVHTKTAAVADRVLAPKVRGTLVLASVLRDTELDFFVLCSSLSSVVGGVGQVDYVAANAFLDAFAHYEARRSGSIVTAIGWDGWAEVGMAARAAAEGHRPGSRQGSARSSVAHYPLLAAAPPHPERLEYSTSLSAASDWVIGEHRVGGAPTLVGTAWLDLTLAAFRAVHGGASDVAFQEVVFSRPLTMAPDQQRVVTVSLQPRAPGKHDFRLVSAAPSGDGEWQEHAHGRVEIVAASRGPRVPLADIMTRCEDDPSVHSRAGSPIELGARWECVRRRWFGKHEALAVVELPGEFTSDLGSFLLHPALLDAATGFFGARRPGAFLPVGYRGVVVHGPLPQRVFSYVTGLPSNAAGADTISPSVVITDPEGQPLVTIESYLLRRTHA